MRKRKEKDVMGTGPHGGTGGKSATGETHQDGRI